MSESYYEKPLIIDAFLANDEIELASFRISYLETHVDMVVIGESNTTFRGNSKPLYFKNWLEKLPHVSQKVMTVNLDLRGDDAWQRESSAREALLEFLISNYADAGYIISDLDEIPSRSQVERMREIQGNYHFRTPTFYRKANWSTLDWNRNWNKAVFTTRNEKWWPNAGRHMKLPVLESDDEGCHFSYLAFDARRMQSKLKSFSHEELDRAEIYHQSFLDYCDRFLIDHLGRIDSDSFGLLRQLKYDQLPAISKELYSYNPNFFDFGNRRVSIISRLIASAIVSMIARESFLSRDAFSVVTSKQLSPPRKIFLYLNCLRLIMNSITKKQGRKLRIYLETYK
jgi:hypothetical protein